MPGGLPVLLIPLPGSVAATVAVWWRTGARYETPETRGAHHLLEHLLIDSPRCDDDGLTHFVESCGGETSAFTSKEHLVCFCRVPATSAGPAARRLAARICQPPLAQEEFERERRVVREELLQAVADPADRVFDLANERLFATDTLGLPTGGTVDDVERRTLPDLLSLHRQRFHAGTVGVVGVGGMEGGDLLSALRDSPLAALEPGEWSPEKAPTDRRSPPHPPLSPPEEGSAHLVVAALGPGYGDPDLTALEVVNELLAGGSRSDLVDILRNQHGLCYGVWSHYVAYRGVGQWRAYLATRAETADQAIELVRATIEDRLRRGWSTERIEAAARRIAGRLLLTAESSLELALWLGEHRLTANDPQATLGAQIRALEQVQGPQVVAAARRVLDSELQVVVTGS